MEFENINMSYRKNRANLYLKLANITSMTLNGTGGNFQSKWNSCVTVEVMMEGECCFVLVWVINFNFLVSRICVKLRKYFSFAENVNKIIH